MADAQASGACGRKIVWVQVPSPAFFFYSKNKGYALSIKKSSDSKIHFHTIPDKVRCGIIKNSSEEALLWLASESGSLEKIRPSIGRYRFLR